MAAEIDKYSMVKMLRTTAHPEASPAMSLAGMASVLSCRTGSFEGTAPGISAPDEAGGRQSGNVWFRCDTAGLESKKDFRGHAIGWTHGDEAWLVVGENRGSAAHLIALLIEEAAHVHWAKHPQTQTPKPHPTTTPAADGWVASQHLVEYPWPTQPQEAASVLAEALIGRLGDEGWALSPDYEGMLTASRDGEDDVVVISFPTKELRSPAMNLAASFGLVYSCARGTYNGTAPFIDEYSGTGARAGKEEPVWFSCDVRGAEGDPGYRGKAVGWTGKRAAWLVVSHDRATSKSVVGALIDVMTARRLDQDQD